MRKSVVIIVVALLFAGSGLLAQTSRPANAKVTNHELFQTMLAFNRRTLVGAYELAGRKNPKWDADAQAFLELVAQRWSRKVSGQWYAPKMDLSDATVMKLADAVVESGCDDPLVRYCRARMMRDAGAEKTAWQTELTEALPGLLAGDYPSLRKCFAASIYIEECKPPADDPLARQARAIIPVELVKALKAPDAEPLERRLKYHILDSNFKALKIEEREKCLSEMEKAEVDAWLIGIFKGRGEITAAWELRGGGWANDVTPEGWRGFYDHLGKARQALLEAHRREPGYPDAAAMMISVAMGAGSELNESERDWFDRAIEAQIDCDLAWSSISNALLPRWGGSHREMYQLGCRAMRTDRYDTDVPYFLPTVLKTIANDKQDYRFFFKERGLAGNVDRVYAGYLAHPMPGMNLDWIKSCWAAYSFRCHQYAQTVKLADELKDALDPAAFSRLELDTRESLDLSRGIVADSTGELRRAFDAEEERSWRDARDHYALLLRNIAEDHPNRRLVESHWLSMSLLTDLSEGNEAIVPLQMPNDLLAWRGNLTPWTCAADGATFKAAGEEDSKIYHIAPLPRRDRPGDPQPGRRVALEWSWITPDPDHAPGFGVILQDIGNDDAIAVTAFPKINGVQVAGRHWSIKRNQQVDPKLLAPDQWHQLEINHVAKTVSVKLDGVMVIEDATNDWLGYGNPVLGLWTKSPGCGATVRVRNVKIAPAE